MHNHWIRFATFCKRDYAIDVKSHYCFFHAPISTLLTCISHFQTPFLYSLWIHFINYINLPNTLQNEDHCTRKKITGNNLQNAPYDYPCTHKQKIEQTKCLLGPGRLYR